VRICPSHSAIVVLTFSVASSVLSCNNSPDKKQGASAPEQYTEQILQPNKGGDFRGVSIGDQPTNVLQSEGRETVYSMPDELVYRIPISQKDSTFYEVSYNFNQQGLYDINLEIFAPDHRVLQTLADEFREHYRKKYGPESSGQHRTMGWRVMTSNGSIVSITISDSLIKLQKPCLRINFNESEQ
jgi:hypothetical protein